MHLARLLARRALWIEDETLIAGELKRLLVDAEHKLAAALGHRIEAADATDAWIKRAISILLAADHLQQARSSRKEQ